MERFSFKNVLQIFYYPRQERTSAQSGTNQLENKTIEYFSVLQAQHFLDLIKDNVIQEFLEFDRCFKLADKYLLAMVFIYFVRAKLPLSEYSRKNFFAALYLAHDIEEDDEDLKICFIYWGLGVTHKKDFDYFLSLRDSLWKAMNYRACVSLKTCHVVMNSIEDCPLWERERDPAHGGAYRDYETRTEECKHCHLLDENKRYYWSDYEFSITSEDSEECSNGSNGSSGPRVKRPRYIEE